MLLDVNRKKLKAHCIYNLDSADSPKAHTFLASALKQSIPHQFTCKSDDSLKSNKRKTFSIQVRSE